MENNNLEKNKNGTKFKQPYLITRFGIAFIDFILVLTLTIGLQAGFYFTCFDAFGYSSKKEEIRQLAYDSGLYVCNGSSYLEIDKAYDNDNEKLLVYDDMITYYYTHDEIALKENKLETYNEAKLLTQYFKYDENNNLVPKETIASSYLLSFYETEYDTALEHFRSNPTYLVDANDTYLIFVLFLVLSVILSSSVFYFLIPLITKNKQTVGQILFKAISIDSKNEVKITNKKIVFKGIIITLFEYVIPILVFANYTMLSLIPFFVTILLMSFSKKNLSVAEYFSTTMTITIREGIPDLSGKKDEVIDGTIY